MSYRRFGASGGMALAQRNAPIHISGTPSTAPAPVPAKQSPANIRTGPIIAYSPFSHWHVRFAIPMSREVRTYGR